jgi:epoxyqueuosine reductase
MARPNEDLANLIIEKALEFGANLAGIANVQELKHSPSHDIYGKLSDYKGVGTIESGYLRPGKIVWPEKAKSAVVIAIEHPEKKPDMDWWQDGYSGGTEGNRILISIIARLAEWLEKEKGMKSHKLPYFIERGGIFLKDAAVLSGLGCIGRNNTLVTMKYGPRVRLRAMLLDKELLATGPIDFDPCEECEMPCRNICPQKAFQNRIYAKEKFGSDKLPGRSGVFSRDLCNVQMELDVDNSEEIKVEDLNTSGKLIKYCRLCEFSCPVGQNY